LSFSREPKAFSNYKNEQTSIKIVGNSRLPFWTPPLGVGGGTLSTSSGTANGHRGYRYETERVRRTYSAVLACSSTNLRESIRGTRSVRLTASVGQSTIILISWLRRDTISRNGNNVDKATGDGRNGRLGEVPPAGGRVWRRINRRQPSNVYANGRNDAVAKCVRFRRVRGGGPVRDRKTRLRTHHRTRSLRIRETFGVRHLSCLVTNMRIYQI